MEMLLNGSMDGGLAAVIARYVPWLGWIGLVNSIYQVSRKTQEKYNLIARPKDRIQWTSF
jgi:hypothetical protein